jgi:hypothetical protein
MVERSMIPRIAVALALLAAPASAGDWPGGWGRGPFDFRNEHIVSLTHLTLGADSARVAPAGTGEAAVRTEVAQTSHAPGGSNQFVLDAETVDLSVSARYGLIDRLDVGFEMPVIWRYGGFLDWSIEKIEGTYDEVRKARARRPRDVYAAEGVTNHGRPFDLDEGVGAGKLRLSAKVAILDDPDWLALSAEAITALPTATGDFGTYGVDVGLRVALQRRFGFFHAYVGACGIVLGPSEYPIRLEPTKGDVFVAGELRFSEYVSIVVQGALESATTTDLERAPTYIVWYGGGFKFGWDRWRFEIAAVENGGDVKYSMDVALHFAFAVRF